MFNQRVYLHVWQSPWVVSSSEASVRTTDCAVLSGPMRWNLRSEGRWGDTCSPEEFLPCLRAIHMCRWVGVSQFSSTHNIRSCSWLEAATVAGLWMAAHESMFDHLLCSASWSARMATVRTAFFVDVALVLCSYLRYWKKGDPKVRLNMGSVACIHREYLSLDVTSHRPQTRPTFMSVSENGSAKFDDYPLVMKRGNGKSS